MLDKVKNSKKSEGFTIIEVMIVLAIAGLILLIVFLAVPALQRNSRNTQRKTDIGRIGSAATTVVSNNNGTISAATFTTATINAEVGSNLSFYLPAGVSAQILGVGGSAANPNNKDNVVVVGNGKCNNTAAAYSSRQIAVLYTLESGTGLTQQCTDQ